MNLHIQLIRGGLVAESFPVKNHAVKFESGAAVIFKDGHYHRIYNKKMWDEIQFNHVQEDENETTIDA